MLIGIGNLLRVTSELATIWTPWAYAWMPVSAVFEWTALLLFTISVCLLFWHRDPLIRSGRVTVRSSLAVVLAQHPCIEDVLIAEGSAYLARARTVPNELTIGTFACSEGRQPDAVVNDLNQRLQQGEPLKLPTCSQV